MTFRHALVAGKFMPLHCGHINLIQTALDAADKVTVFVVWQGDQHFSEFDRRLAVSLVFSKEHERINVIPVVDLFTDDDTADSHILWAHYTHDILGDDLPDVIFGNDDYVQGWADALRVPARIIDRERTLFPISATEIRKDPYLNWESINKYAQGRYRKHVAILGAESTGKTTLAKKLAQLYGTVMVPEEGRLYSETHQEKDSEMDEMHKYLLFADVINKQRELARTMAERARFLLFHDTDLYTTYLWYRRWFPHDSVNGMEAALLSAAKSYSYQFDLVLIMDPNTEFVQDGYREFNQEDRNEFTEQLKEAYGYMSKPKNSIFEKFYGQSKVVMLNGDWHEREDTAIAAVNDLFQESNVVLP